jgi:uncharacterized protein YoaH (UPF0181 family)
LLFLGGGIRYTLRRPNTCTMSCLLLQLPSMSAGKHQQQAVFTQHQISKVVAYGTASLACNQQVAKTVHAHKHNRPKQAYLQVLT